MIVVTREDFVRQCLAQLALRPPYVWGGKSDAGLDCSGFVTLALHRASKGALDWRQTHNTDALWKLPRIALEKDVLHGDLALYWGAHSTGPMDVSHVMVCAGAGIVYGQAYGGPGDTDPVASRAAGKVTQVLPLRYRPDLAGFVRLPLT